MSKRHKHRYDYELEQRLAFIEHQRQLVILILILLMYTNRNIPPSNRIINKNQKRNIPGNTKGTASAGAESEVYQLQALVKSVNKGGITKENDKTSQEEFKPDNLKQAVEETNNVQGETEVVYADIKVYRASTIQSDLMDDVDEYRMQVNSKLPILLSNANVQVLVEALTRFPEQVFEIKDIEKNIVIRECRLIPGTNKLIIQGMILEKVEYESIEYNNENLISGAVKSTVFEIPFKGSAEVCFSTKPEKYKYNSDYEIEFVNINGNSFDIYEKSSIHQEPINKKIFVELDSMEILETDIQEGTQTMNDVHTFENVRKKIVVNLGLNLLQIQEVLIDGSNVEDIK